MRSTFHPDPERTSMRAPALALSAPVLALGLAALGLSSPVAAQGRSADDTGTIDSYQVTMPVLRKVLPALYAPGAQSCPRASSRDPHALAIAEIVQSLEPCAPVVQSLKRAGVPIRDAAIVFASLLRTSQQVAMQGGNASALATGIVRDNALLLEQNDPEIKKLTKTGAQS